MRDSPKHRSITGQLATEILAGKYNQSGRLPSETQLVRRFGVSRPTISQALRGLQEQGMVERRPGSGTYLSLSHSSGEIRQPASRSARPLLGMIVPSLRHTEIFESIVGEIAGLIRGGEYDFWPGMTAKPLSEPRMTVEEAEALCERFIQEGVRGVFLVPFEHQADREDANRRIAARLRLAGIPLVLIDRDIGPFPVRSAYDLIGTDNFSGGYQLATHLIKLGVRRPVYVVRPLTASTVDARIAGVRTAMIAHGLEVPRHLVQTGEPGDLKFIKAFLKTSSPDAVLCASDHVAAQLLQSLNRLGIHVPDDLKIVGFDNVPFSSLLTVPLTTMEQSCGDIAATALHALRDRIHHPALPPRTHMLNPRLVVRESCGAYLSTRPPGQTG